MIEFLRHATGMCGEPHPSLLTLLMGTPAAGFIIYKIKSYKYRIKKVTNAKINIRFVLC